MTAGFDYRQAEMMDRASLDALVASLDRLDVLVNNAGGNFMSRGEWNPEAPHAGIDKCSH